MDKFICAICGKEHDTYESYASCVQNCAKRRKEQEEREREARLTQEKEERQRELDALYDRYAEALEAYVRDYSTRPVPSRLKDDETLSSDKDELSKDDKYLMELGALMSLMLG